MMSVHKANNIRFTISIRAFLIIETAEFVEIFLCLAMQKMPQYVKKALISV
jgi:hypothetical protein